MSVVTKNQVTISTEIPFIMDIMDVRFEHFHPKRTLFLFFFLFLIKSDDA